MPAEAPQSGPGEPLVVLRRPRIGRLLLIVSAGAVLVVAARAVQYFWFELPLGAGPVAIAVPRGPFGQVWTTRPVLLLGIGDSVTDGFGARPGYDYFDRLTANPPDEFADMQGICLSAVLPNLRTRNTAVSGSTSIDHEQRLRLYFEPQPADVFGIVVITTGGNDIIHDYGRKPPREGAMYGASFEQAKPWIAAFEQRLRGIVARVEECFPGGCRIFLASIYDPTDGVGDAARAGLPVWKDAMRVVAAYNEIIARVAAEDAAVCLVDLHDVFLGHGIHCTQFWREHYRGGDPTYWYYSNLEDPNERGYDAIRRLFLIEIARALAQDGIPATQPSS